MQIVLIYIFEMYIFRKLLLILLLCLPGVITEESVNSRSKDAECGSYCYKIVKPLLQYASSVRSKENKFNELTATIQKLEENIASLESQLALSKSNQKYCLTQEQMLTANQALVNKLQKIEDQLNTTLKIKDSEISKKKSEKATDASKTKEIEKNTETKEIEKNTKPDLPTSCIGKQTDGLEIKVPGSKSFYVSCDSTLVSPGWIVIQRRQDGSESFYRNMEEYRKGFGKLNKEFFIGLDRLYILTNFQQHELYIYLRSYRNEVRYARYSNFRIGGLEEHFKLKSLGEYSGNAGNAMDYYLNMPFSTHDQDHDNDPLRNCANLFRSGWWYNGCHHSNLNGVYRTAIKANSVGINWKSWHTNSLQFVQMMIRPVK